MPAISDQSCDTSGNCATGTLQLSLDNTAPVASNPSWSANPVAVGSNTTLTVAASDSLSGVTGGEYFVGTDPGVGSATAMTYSGGNL